MKIKTLKIKVENENQDFDFQEFFTGSNQIFYTAAHVVKEEGGMYWYAFITYEPQKSYSPLPIPRQEIELPKGFADEIKSYVRSASANKTRCKNAILGGMDQLPKIKEIEGFYLLRNLSNKSVNEDSDFFAAVLEIIKKYQPAV